MFQNLIDLINDIINEIIISIYDKKHFYHNPYQDIIDVENNEIYFDE